MFKFSPLKFKTQSDRVIIFLMILFLFTIVFPYKAKAQTDINQGIANVVVGVDKTAKKVEVVAEKLWVKMASAAFKSAINNALNRLAMDTATYIGSGGSGQKPLFIEKGWGAYAEDIASDAAGAFIDQINKWGNFNLCEPSIDVKASIGFGLSTNWEPLTNKNNKPVCTWKKMKEAWTNEAERLKSMKEPDYLKKLSNMFKPGSNDLSVSLSLFAGMEAEAKKTEQQKMTEAASKQGWLDVRNIAGNAKTTPQEAKDKKSTQTGLLIQNFGKYTGQALVDAANVFLNQLAITSFNNAMGKLTSGELFTSKESQNSVDSAACAFAKKMNLPKTSEVYKNSCGSSAGNAGGFLSNANSDFNAVKNQTSFQGYLSSQIRAKFNVRADYDILNELSICLDPKKSGPTNCVIDDKFRQAIEDQKTVIEAINEGFLNKSWVFRRGLEYNQGYSYRSMVILRKYRILPVGWETALIKAEEQGKTATLMDLVSCFDPNDNYTEYTDEFEPGEWCVGLVDPYWVLKAPLGYCKRSGFGGQVVEKSVVPEIKNGNTVIEPASVVLSRTDNYCADEQSCIKEKADGSCEAYGYCTEEKRTWNFGADSCDPVFNTCQNFTGSEGQVESYLENTIDYSTCSSDNAGCRPYSTFGVYSSSTGSVAWKSLDLAYFNKKMETCTAEDEGCSEFMRVKNNNGLNFIVNGDFEQGLETGNWDVNSGGVSNNSTIGAGYFSSSALNIESLVKKEIAVGPSDYNAAGQAYNFSFYAQCDSAGTFSLGTNVGENIKNMTVSADWQYYSVNYVVPTTDYTNKLLFTINSPICLIDKLKLELNSAGTYYSDYGANNLIYQKLIPGYLEANCYVNAGSGNKDYNLKNDAPAACSQFTRRCNASDVDCELYTSKDGNLSLPAKAATTDYCSGQCVGYDSYVQKASYFNDATAANFIPSSATKCTADTVGCNEFTNLDSLAQGGESKEYYSELRSCIKPDNTKCTSFFSWEGTNGQGYDLKAYSLEKNTNGFAMVTVGSIDATGKHIDGLTTLCDATIFNYPPSHPDANSDCRQFYTQSGSVFYALYSKTITCAANCHPYRITENIGSAKCSATRGTWDAGQNFCTYMAIPGEGKKCTAAQNGCREYSGNQGNSTRIVASYDFDSSNAWSGNVALSNESLKKNGKSLSVNGMAEVALGSDINQGKSYVVRFLAKAAVGSNVLFSFSQASPPMLFNAVSVVGDGQWHLYQANLDDFSRAVDPSEKLNISASGVYIDDIVLTEISDRYYLIKDSWNTPDVCYYDTLDQYQGINYNLGCNQYTDRAKSIHNLRQFSKLCSDSAVGCELAIATYGNSEAAAKAYGETGTADNACSATEEGCLSVPADQLMYVVYDPAKQCNSSSKGCSRLGRQLIDNPDLSVQGLYEDVYLKNNPAKYGDADGSGTMCRASEVGCDEWKYGDGQTSYFKDPGVNVCEWRAGKASGLNVPKAWFKKQANRCDSDVTGKGVINPLTEKTLCSTNADCPTNVNCIPDTNDYLCPVDSLKTIGYGGQGSKIYQPKGMTGICNSNAASCTEYIDPVSEFSPNLIINSSFGDLNGDCVYYDGWENVAGGQPNCSIFTSPGCSPNMCSFTASSTGAFISKKQTVKLKTNKLYALSTLGGQSVTLTCPNTIYLLTATNDFIVPSATVFTDENISFYSGDNEYCEITYKKSFSSAINRDPSSATDASIFYHNNNVGGELNYENKKIEPQTKFISWIKNIFSIKSAEAQSVVNSTGYLSLRESIVDYKISSDLTDEGCNGAASLDNGCILFNERNLSQGVYATLNGKWNAYSSYGAGVLSNCTTGRSCNSNKLLKVKPSRVCDKWLACKASMTDSVTGDPVCYGLGECNRVDDKGNCANFLKTEEADHTFSYGNDRNSAGYNKLGYYYLANMKEVGVEPEGNSHFDFEGSKCDTFGQNCIDNPSDQLTSGTNLPANSYPAIGKSFLGIKGTSQLVVVSGVAVLANKDYYINYLINLDQAPGGAKIYFNNTLATSVPMIGRGWQRLVSYYKPTTSGSLSIGFSGLDTNDSVFIDDVHIEPVLKAGDNKYIAKECRLYPKADSLECKSLNETVVQNGLYGYCLERDPNDSNICLMWYPMDNVRSSDAGNNAVTGYHGVNDLYYCTETQADYPIAGHRSTIDNDNKTLTSHVCSPNLNPLSCARTDSFPGVCVSGVSNAASECPACQEGYYQVAVFNGAASGPVNGSCVISFSDMQQVKCICSTVPESSLIGSYSGGTITGPSYSAPGLLSLWHDRWNTSGWFTYDQTKFYDDPNGDGEIPAVVLNSAFWDTNAFKKMTYTPQCTKSIQVDTGAGVWAGRLSSNNKAILDYASDATSNPGFPSTATGVNTPTLQGNGALEHRRVTLNFMTNPYGAALSNPYNKYLKGDESPSSELFLPYACTGQNCGSVNYLNGQGKYNTTPYYNGSLFNVTGLSGYPNYSTTNKYSEAYLKNIFLKTAGSSGGGPAYNYLSPGLLSACPFETRPTDDTKFCYVLPKLTNIKLFAPSGIEVTKVGDEYPLSVSGFYTLTFNTAVDAEQAPIKKLTIDWGDGSILPITNVDSQSNATNPHKLFYQYNKSANLQKVKIKIKIEDSWGYYKCDGAVGQCCISGFDNNYCSA